MVSRSAPNVKAGILMVDVVEEEDGGQATVDRKMRRASAVGLHTAAQDLKYKVGTGHSMV